MATHNSTQEWVHEMTEAFICSKTLQSNEIFGWHGVPEINIVERIILGTFIPYTVPGPQENISYRLEKNKNADDIQTHSQSDSTTILTKEKIYTRLAIINSLFSTNVEKGYFILQEMTDAIWEASKDTFGYYSDAALAYKAEDYIQQCLCQDQPDFPHHPIQLLLDTQFKWIRHDDSFLAQKEISLLSKYLHYLLEAAGSRIGFPIMDTLLQDGIQKSKNFNTTNEEGAFLSNALTQASKFFRNGLKTFPDYAHALDTIGKLLDINASDEWSYFHILDRILWPIFKVASARYVPSDKTNMPKQAYNGTPTYNMTTLHLLLASTELDAIIEYYQDPNSGKYQVGVKGIPMDSDEFKTLLTITKSLNFPNVCSIITIMESIL